MQLPVLPQQRESEPAENGARPERLVAWAVHRFASRRLITTTQFGMEGCALIDMLSRTGVTATVVYLDTHFLFEETHRLRDRLAQRYPSLRFVNRGTSLTPREQDSIYGPELWRRDAELCCSIRKVEPMRRALADADAWMTGIRRDQTPSRATIEPVEWDWRFDVLKISPLAHWSRGEVWEYVRANGVPYNPMHDREYPSIGCTHCTRPVRGSGASDYARTGRWAGSSRSECGLHSGFVGLKAAVELSRNGSSDD